MKNANLPDWFDVERYIYPSLADEEQAKGAALAVLDRVPLFQTVTHPGFDPPAWKLPLSRKH